MADFNPAPVVGLRGEQLERLSQREVPGCISALGRHAPGTKGTGQPSRTGFSQLKMAKRCRRKCDLDKSCGGDLCSDFLPLIMHFVPRPRAKFRKFYSMSSGLNLHFIVQFRFLIRFFFVLLNIKISVHFYVSLYSQRAE